MHSDLELQQEVPGEQAPDAGAQDPSFDALLEANPLYRQAHNDRVRRAVEGRLRGHREERDRLRPLMEALEKRYGCADVEGLVRAVAEDRPILTRQQKLEAFRGQVAATRNRFPGFRLEQEARNPTFRRMVAAGMPMQDAYRLAHQDRALTAAMGYAIQRTRRAMADQIRAGGLRPGENALTGRAILPARPDPRRLTGQQRRDLKARVARGEKVYW